MLKRLFIAFIIFTANINVNSMSAKSKFSLNKRALTSSLRITSKLIQTANTSYKAKSSSTKFNPMLILTNKFSTYDNYYVKQDQNPSKKNTNTYETVTLDIEIEATAVTSNTKNNKSLDEPDFICAGENIKTTKFFINRRYDLNTTDKNGQTPLIKAILSGNIDLAKFLIDNGADVNAKYRNNNGITPLIASAETGKQDETELLINNGADVNAKNNDGDGPLTFATARGYKGIAKLLINNGANVNAKNNNGNTPLMSAAIYGHIKLIELLIYMGANVNAKNHYGNTPLISSLLLVHFIKSTDIAKILIDNGADVNAKNHYGYTALIKAIDHGCIDMIKLFIDAKADINTQNIGRDNALICALRNLPNSNNIVGMLMRAGAEVPAGISSTDMITLFMLAARYGNNNILKSLISSGIDVNMQASSHNSDILHDEKGYKEKYTALMFAAENGRTDAVKLLLESGANVNEKYGITSGDTALRLAEKLCHQEIAELLRSRGAK